MTRRSLRQRIADPRLLRRLAVVLILNGTALALIATLLRDAAGAGAGTYVLDTAAWLFAVVGAGLEARVSTILAPFQPAAVRRRGLLLAILGITVCLGSCVTLSAVSGGGSATIVRACAAALLVAGLGSGLGGLLSLAVTSGARYAADRLAHLDDD